MSNSFETTKANIPLDSTTFKDITPPGLFGASIVCQKHDIYIVFAANAKEALTKFYDNKFFRLDAGDWRSIQDNQGNSKQNRVFAICLGADENLGNTLKNAIIVTGGTVPDTSKIQMNANHGFTIGEFVTISGTTNYDGTFEIIDLPALDIITIFRKFNADTPAGTETCKQYPTVEMNYISGE